MPRGTALSGISGQLGIKRRDDPLAYGRAWTEANREKVNAYHREYHQRVIKKDPEKYARKLKSGAYSRRKTKYGITKPEYLNLLTQQQGLCMICQEHKGDQLRVDHDHITGQVRGLLCSQCNSALGLMKEDPERIRRMAEYAERHKLKEG